MVFSSILFLFRFLPIFFIVYFMAPKRMKNFILFFGSLIFYAWGEPVYVVLMLFSTISDYLHGRWIDSAKREGRQQKAKIFLLSSVIINLAMLGFFKYADFLIASVNGIFGINIPLLHLPLPIGISFYTFQTMSYSIDVYKGEVPVQKNIISFGTFVTMFPQLIAGPIVKYKTVQEKLDDRTHNADLFAHGLRRFLTGLAKKVLLANNIGLLWTEILAIEISSLPVATAWIGIIAFAFQIYFDFSGYSDMAIGLGAIMGFHFPENFNYPYISKSITEFWRRWHISLGSWFKEYVYIPLGGNRRGIRRQIINILIVWCLTGIWHGAGWNFLIWGLWFAFFLIMEKLFLLKWLERLPKVVAHLYTLIIVLISWVTFAIESTPQVVGYYQAMFGLNGAGLFNSQTFYILINYAVIFVILIIAATPFPRKIVDRLIMSDRKVLTTILSYIFFLAILLLSVAYLVDASYNPFLYFRF